MLRYMGQQTAATEQIHKHCFVVELGQNLDTPLQTCASVRQKAEVLPCAFFLSYVQFKFYIILTSEKSFSGLYVVFIDVYIRQVQRDRL